MKIFASSGSWIEGEAVQQLENTASLKGMKTVVGNADLHPGKGCAVGTAAHSEGIIYPHLIGNDIGCGYTLFQTDIKRNANRERLAEKLTGLDGPWDGDLEEFVAGWGQELTHGEVLGTVGGGNHFAELQQIEHTEEDIGLNPDYLVLLVHSGSRSFGESIFQKFAPFCRSNGFEEGSEHFTEYMTAHNQALWWAMMNRTLIARRFTESLDREFRPETLIANLCHNFVEPYQGGYLHRKGAAPTNGGFSPLPGSRSTPTYLLKPNVTAANFKYGADCNLVDEDAGNLSSLAHGAGRKISRSNMRERVTESLKELGRTTLGGVVVCGQEDLLREEHHSAYKPVERVLEDIKSHNLATEVAKMLPVLTYKSERVREDRKPKREKEEGWRRERHKAGRRDR